MPKALPRKAAAETPHRFPVILETGLSNTTGRLVTGFCYKSDMTTYALDFESYYDNDCSVATLGPRAYFSHPEFDAYLMTVAGDDGFRYCGSPREFDWNRLAGQHVIMHNAAFDESLYLFGVERGWWPQVEFLCDCSADMAAYLGMPRSLKEAAASSLDIPMDKTVRDNMKGRRWESMSNDFREQVELYAIKDAEITLQLWQKHQDGWPEHERRISRVNRAIGRRGLPIDQPMLKKSLEALATTLFDAERSIPWFGEKPTLSRPALNDECRKHGLEPPASLAKDNEEADKWFAAHEQEHPWIRAVQHYRSINALLRKLESFDRGTLADGRYYGGFLYFGANPTGRFSGSGGNLNLQNLPKDEMFGIKVRPMIRAKEGHKLIIADLSQIEVRTLSYLANDTETLDLIRGSDDVYHAFGVALGLHDPANGPLKQYSAKLRHKVKGVGLGLGYGMGAARFASVSGQPMEEAEEMVQLYRNRMKKVVSYWKSFDKELGLAFQLGEPLTLELPSGRQMHYGRIKKMRDTTKGADWGFRYFGKLARFGKTRDARLNPPILVENMSQGMARDVFCDMMLRIDAAGIPIIMHVHDEIVCEVPEDQAQDALRTVLEIMHVPPAWCQGLPVAAEGEIHDYYTK